MVSRTQLLSRGIGERVKQVTQRKKIERQDAEIKKVEQEQKIIEEKIAEGIVARSHPLMLFRNGKPMMFKLKVEDYEKLKAP